MAADSEDVCAEEAVLSMTAAPLLDGALTARFAATAGAAIGPVPPDPDLNETIVQGWTVAATPLL